MILIGLTGSIGMGKSTTAKMFAEAGVPVWDADSAVHAIYGPDGTGTRALAKLVPDAIGPDGVDRAKLRAAIIEDADLLPKVEALIHPLVGEDRARFLAEARERGAPLVVCDIPLLFETGGNAAFDKVVVVSAPADVQRARVLERPGMTDRDFEAILAKQVPDAEKRARADFVVDTSKGLEHARDQVLAIIAELTETHDA